MKKRFSVFILFTIFSFSKIYAQHGMGLSLKMSPIASTDFNLENDKHTFGEDDEFNIKFSFKNLIGYQLGFEWGPNLEYMTELTYYHGDVDKVDKQGNYMDFNYSDLKDYHDFDLMFYYQKMINKGHRFWFPISIGAGYGAAWVDDLPTIYSAFHFNAKVGVRFFITNKIAFCIGGTVKYILFSSIDDEEKSSYSKNLDVKHRWRISLDTGLSFIF